MVQHDTLLHNAVVWGQKNLLYWGMTCVTQTILSSFIFRQRSGYKDIVAGTNLFMIAICG